MRSVWLAYCQQETKKTRRKKCIKLRFHSPVYFRFDVIVREWKQRCVYRSMKIQQQIKFIWNEFKRKKKAKRQEKRKHANDKCDSIKWTSMIKWDTDAVPFFPLIFPHEDIVKQCTNTKNLLNPSDAGKPIHVRLDAHFSTEIVFFFFVKWIPFFSFFRGGLFVIRFCRDKCCAEREWAHINFVCVSVLEFKQTNQIYHQMRTKILRQKKYSYLLILCS